MLNPFPRPLKAADKVIPKPFREKSVRALFGDESAQASKGIRGIEKISDRRQINNSFFLTINTGLVGIVSYLNLGHEKTSKTFFFFLYHSQDFSYISLLQ